MEATLVDQRLHREYDPSGPFGLIVVGVDASDEALEAVRQAGALAGPNSTIELLAVGIPDADAVLARAEAELAHSPARVVAHGFDGHPPWRLLLDEAAGADLLVVGKHIASRVGGYMLGSNATHVIHHAHLPILVAVRPASGRFLDRILVAAGPESEHPELPVRTATAIAEHAGSALVLLRVDWDRARKTPEVAEAIAKYERQMSEHVEDVIVGGSPHRHILDEAEREGASLVVLGSRELGGIAFRSVSERVAHEAPCSVLVVHRDG